jgi:hypothetical protein
MSPWRFPPLRVFFVPQPDGVPVRFLSFAILVGSGVARIDRRQAALVFFRYEPSLEQMPVARSRTRRQTRPTRLPAFAPATLWHTATTDAGRRHSNLRRESRSVGDKADSGASTFLLRKSASRRGCLVSAPCGGF